MVTAEYRRDHATLAPFCRFVVERRRIDFWRQGAINPKSFLSCLLRRRQTDMVSPLSRQSHAASGSETPPTDYLRPRLCRCRESSLGAQAIFGDSRRSALSHLLDANCVESDRACCRLCRDSGATEPDCIASIDMTTALAWAHIATMPASQEDRLAVLLRSSCQRTFS
jgi:hypothetical protein